MKGLTLRTSPQMDAEIVAPPMRSPINLGLTLDLDLLSTVSSL